MNLSSAPNDTTAELEREREQGDVEETPVSFHLEGGIKM